MTTRKLWLVMISLGQNEVNHVTYNLYKYYNYLTQRLIFLTERYSSSSGSQAFDIDNVTYSKQLNYKFSFYDNWLTTDRHRVMHVDQFLTQ